MLFRHVSKIKRYLDNILIQTLTTEKWCPFGIPEAEKEQGKLFLQVAGTQ